MNAIKRVSLFPKKRAKQGTAGFSAGFSLIELLVVIGIIGVLAAVAVPAYQSQQVKAKKTAIQASLRTIGEAFNRCIINEPFSGCDTLAEIAVSCPDCSPANTSSTGNKFCVAIDKTVAGTNLKGCVSSAGGALPVTKYFWAIRCSEATAPYKCDGSNYQLEPASSKDCNTLGCAGAAAVPGSCSGSGTINHPCTVSTDPDKMTTQGANTGTCTSGVCN